MFSLLLCQDFSLSLLSKRLLCKPENFEKLIMSSLIKVDKGKHARLYFLIVLTLSYEACTKTVRVDN